MPIYDMSKMCHMGRPKGTRNKKTYSERMTLAKLCKEHSKKAIDTLVAIMNNDEAKDCDRITASIAILDRAYGKPISSVEMLDENGQAVTPQICFYIPDNGRKLDNDFDENILTSMPENMETCE